jgi:RNA polymerase sigma-70 factor (ECF subfamily)
LETLLAHREWVRRVALALVRDENLAQDLEQDLWVKVIEKPPVVRGSVRGWLASTLRNAVIDRFRSDTSRRRLEQVASRAERHDSTEDVVSKADGLKRVVNAVMDLAEPYRTSVLLRYFEDLPPREIAARQGVPVETVRTRLRRAIALLRERFDRESQGNREAWCLAMLPLVRVPESSTPSVAASGTAVVGGMFMAKKAIAVVAVLLLLLGAGAAWKWGWIGSSHPVRHAEIAAFVENPAAAPKPAARPPAADAPAIIEEPALLTPEETPPGPPEARTARRIVVIVKEESGAPAVGERVDVRDDGNNAIAPPGISDKDGRIVFDGVLVGRAHLHLLPSTEASGPSVDGSWYLPVPVGTVNLEAGDAQIEVVLRPPVVLLARVTEDGKPSLPPGLVFGIRGATLRQRTDDPKTGSVRFLLRAGSKDPVIQVNATVAGALEAKAVASWSEQEELFVADLPLKRKPGGTLVVRVKPPAKGRFLWELRRLDGPRGPEPIQGSAFLGVQSDPVTGPPDCPTFGGLKPGRYQFVSDCGLATEPVEFGEEPSTHEVAIDLSKMQTVTGRFEAPPGTDFGRAIVLVEGEDLVAPMKWSQGIGGAIMMGASTRDTFMVRIPGDRPVRLRASHPSLVPAEPGGTFDVQGAAEGVVLRLVEGATAVFRLEPSAPADSDPFAMPPTVHLYRGEPVGEPVSTHIAEGTDVFRIGGFAPGTWTLYIDAPARAPGVLLDVNLTNGKTDLGTIRLEDGASVRFNMKLAPGAAPPNLFIHAWPLGAPGHHRGLNSLGRGDLVLRGLGKGPYRITAYPPGSSTPLLHTRIDSEGFGETVLDLDLR